MGERQIFADLLRNCSKNVLFQQGQQVHGLVTRMGFTSDLMLSNDLIDMYSKCGHMRVSLKVFDKMPERNVVSWTSLMCGYLQNGESQRSFELFREMGVSGIKPNEFTLSTVLKACRILGVVGSGLQTHGVCVKTGFDSTCVVSNCMMDMYAKCGRIDEAARVFGLMGERNVVSWNVMITGYAMEEDGEKALHLFREMQKEAEVPDEYTYTSTLKSCSVLGAIRQGAQIHASLITSGFPVYARTAVAGSLVDLYVKCSCLYDARKVFDDMEEKSVVVWSSLILGYAQDENLAAAMDLFQHLRESNVLVDGFVLSSLMGVFADFAFVEQGKQMHAYTVKVPFGQDISVTNSILDMYLKCGLTAKAERFFTDMPARNVVSWTIMITGYGKHGLGKEAIDFFGEMQLANIEPDGVTYLAVLSACSHSGLVEESKKFFSKLCADKDIKPQIEHYACMVDVLGRAGWLKEAKSLIEGMPFKPNAGIWQTLLSACKVHGDMEMGREIGYVLLKMDGYNPVNYVMMSNLYLEAGYCRESERLREMVKLKRLKKEGGCSWVEIDKKLHFFYSADDSHPLSDRILVVLKEMEKRLKEEIGFVYQVSIALHDVEEESKAESLRYHSEKLAIGLVLVMGGLEQEGKVIRIFKNLRVCGDCHEFIKGLSRILKIVFMVRDANRFHKFQDGICSCGDYW